MKIKDKIFKKDTGNISPNKEINKKILEQIKENSLAKVKNENLILDKKEDETKSPTNTPVEIIEPKQNTKTFGKNPVEVKEVQIISFKDSLKKNFNLQRYEKMESNIAWVKIVAILLVVLTHTIQSSLGWASANGGQLLSYISLLVTMLIFYISSKFYQSPVLTYL